LNRSISDDVVLITHLLSFLEILEDICPGEGTAGDPGTAYETMKARRTVHREDNHGEVAPNCLLNREPGARRATGDKGDHPERGPDECAIPDEERGDHLPPGGTLRGGTLNDLTT